MKCDCTREIAQRLRGKLTGEDDCGSLKPKGGTLEDVSASNIALMLDEGTTALQIPFDADWTLATGKRKRTRVAMLASFCPFCGKSTGR